MIEAIVIFKDGVQNLLTLNVTFEDDEKEIETFSKIGFIKFNTFNERIPSYMHILGRMLKKRAEVFWDEEKSESNGITDPKLWGP
ncbi:hypothetical protein LCGC14_1269700 [marine sediment metagenome]|uniref:Uncharacterized protein n=1 Tax=marine sediment metagenome TaxID=412755 RepID=A0A0F9NF87_9ZZZZ|nr:MAG: hypothetical protein Lokiarch_26990 [Candidatus Lokiarchaeum sp. GC14_75]